MNKLSVAVVLLLVIAVGLMTANLFKAENVQAAKADAGAAGNLIAVTGSLGGSTDAVYVILRDEGGAGSPEGDSSEGPTIHMACYGSQGGSIKLMSVRELTYDLKVRDYEPGRPSAADMRREYLRGRGDNDRDR